MKTHVIVYACSTLAILFANFFVYLTKSELIYFMLKLTDGGHMSDLSKYILVSLETNTYFIFPIACIATVSVVQLITKLGEETKIIINVLALTANFVGLSLLYSGLLSTFKMGHVI